MHVGKQGKIMAYATAEVIPNTREGKPFKVVFMQGARVLTEWPVDSVADGEAQIVNALLGLGLLDI
jgi:hypothetical protein